MPGACCTRGLVCNCAKKTHTSIQVQRKHSGIPCARERMGAKSRRLIQRGATVVFTFVSRSDVDLAAERNMGTC